MFTAQSLCPAGWEDFQSTCYAFGTDKVKFVDAVVNSLFMSNYVV